MSEGVSPMGDERALAERLRRFEQTGVLHDRNDLSAAADIVERHQKLVDANDLAVIELRAVHRPEVLQPGKAPIGCVVCYPADGSWPCVTSMVADDLAEAVEVSR